MLTATSKILANIRFTVEGDNLIAEGQLTDDQRHFIRNNKQTLLTELRAANELCPLTTEQESAIKAWLARIRETDPRLIAMTIDQCRWDGEARDYVLREYEKTG